MADGAITFSTALDNAQLDKQLQSLKKKIISIEDKISQKQAERTPFSEQSKQLAADLDAAKARLEYMKSGKEFFTSSQIFGQANVVKESEKSWNAVQSKVERYDSAISSASIELGRAKERAGAIAQELSGAGYNAVKMDKATKKANNSMGRFALRMREVVRSALVFTLITQALAKLREWVGKIVKTNKEAVSAIAKLKAALLVLAQPLVDVLVPAFTVFVQILTQIILKISQLFSMLTGKTIEQSEKSAKALSDETEALDKTGDAAKDAAKSMAAFDEINQISGGEQGNEGKNDEITPDFNFVGGSRATEDELKGILGLIELIGASILAWKLSDSFVGGLKTAMGLLIALQGAILFIKNALDAWTTGIDWDNFLGMLAGAAVFVAGLALAFGKVGAAIGLIIAGIALFVVGIHDAIENGWNLQNTLTTITGMISTGLGISLLVGSWIPLVIAGIASALFALAVATGHGEELIDGFKDVISGFRDFFVGIFTGDIPDAIDGMKKGFDGIDKIVNALISGLKDTILSFFSWVDEKTGYQFTDLFSYIKSIVSFAFDWMIDYAKSMIDALKEIFSGIITFIAGVFTNDWDMAFDGVKRTWKGLFQYVTSVFSGAANLIIGIVNLLIDAINTLKVDVPDWIPLIGGKKWDGFDIPRLQEIQIPHLATGAVIPPNREFMAVLGDQKSGTNIEAPMGTIKQGIREVMNEMGITGGGQSGDLILQIDGKTFARLTNPYAAKENQRVGIKMVEGV